MSDLTVKDLFLAGVHFGHQLRRWNPKLKPYIFTHKNRTSIIDLGKTLFLLKQAANYLKEKVAAGGDILLVGTKRQAQQIIQEAGTTTRMPFVANRWLGGTLTNFATIRKSIQKYHKYVAMENSGSLNKLPGKEAAAIRREMSRLIRNFEGLLQMESLPTALFVVDIHNESIAVAEANRLQIPVVGLVDTNSDPTRVQYPIPGNDDSVKSIRVIVEVMVEAIQEGLVSREQKHRKPDIKPIYRGPLEDTLPEGEVVLPEGYDAEEIEEGVPPSRQ